MTGDLISYETYLGSILDQVVPLTPIRVGTTPATGPDTPGLVTAAPVSAVWDTPSFTNSAMDGFACAASDLASATPDDDGTVVLPVTGDIAAGETGVWQSGSAVRIMTGAPLPQGADTVVPVEFTDHPLAHEPVPVAVRLPANWPVNRHVRHRGSDVASGAELIGAGVRLDGAALSALAGSGVLSVSVRPRPKVAVIVTGDELMTLDDIAIAGGVLGAGKILDSNAILVRSTLESFGAQVAFAATCGDDPVEFDRCLAQAFGAGVDVVVTTGGASVGAHDVARQVLSNFGVTFQSVAIQPAKPQGFGVIDGVAVCALPGNPGAVHASLWVLVRPLLAQLTGAPQPGVSPFTVAQGWSAKAGMRQFVPVVIDATSRTIRPVIAGGVASHRVRSLAQAHGLASIAPDVTDVVAGELIDVIVTRM